MATPNSFILTLKKHAKRANAGGTLSHGQYLELLSRHNGFSSWERMATSLAEGNAKFATVESVKFPLADATAAPVQTGLQALLVDLTPIGTGMGVMRVINALARQRPALVALIDPCHWLPTPVSKPAQCLQTTGIAYQVFRSHQARHTNVVAFSWSKQNPEQTQASTRFQWDDFRIDEDIDEPGLRLDFARPALFSEQYDATPCYRRRIAVVDMREIDSAAQLHGLLHRIAISQYPEVHFIDPEQKVGGDGMINFTAAAVLTGAELFAYRSEEDRLQQRAYSEHRRFPADYVLRERARIKPLMIAPMPGSRFRAEIIGLD